MQIVRLPGVYRPDHDSRMLSAALRAHVPPGGAVLDLCAGSGILGISAARAGAGRVVAVDVSRRAAWTTKINAACNRVSIEVRRGDLRDAVANECFDLVVSNPPYVPSRDLPSRGRTRAWDAGPTGRAVLDAICGAAPRLLAPGGRIMLVHSAVASAETTVQALADGGLDAEVSETSTIPFGPVMRERAAWLRGRHLLGSSSMEKLVIVSAVRRRLRAPCSAPQASAVAEEPLSA